MGMAASKWYSGWMMPSRLDAQRFGQVLRLDRACLHLRCRPRRHEVRLVHPEQRYFWGPGSGHGCWWFLPLFAGRRRHQQSRQDYKLGLRPLDERHHRIPCELRWSHLRYQREQKGGLFVSSLDDAHGLLETGRGKRVDFWISDLFGGGVLYP